MISFLVLLQIPCMVIAVGKDIASENSASNGTSLHELQQGLASNQAAGNGTSDKRPLSITSGNVAPIGNHSPIGAAIGNRISTGASPTELQPKLDRVTAGSVSTLQPKLDRVTAGSVSTLQPKLDRVTAGNVSKLQPKLDRITAGNASLANRSLAAITGGNESAGSGVIKDIINRTAGIDASKGAPLKKLREELNRFFTPNQASGDYNQVKDILDQIRRAAAFAAPQGGPEVKLNTENPEDESELAKNNRIAKDLFEGDIVLNVGQAKSILEEVQKEGAGRPPQRRVKRKIVRDSADRWPNRLLYYTFDSDLDDYKLQVIKAAIKAWENNTCLRFQEGEGQGDFVTFFSGSGCYGHVGVAGGQQGISIGDGCEAAGIAAHEIAHALGAWHEQNRYDRNDYIQVMYDNIDPYIYGNFIRIPRSMMDDFGVPYDLGSVMHYGSKAFSESWDLLSIRTLDPNYQRTIGQRQSLSFIDVKQINRAYCRDICPNQLPCQHEGYTDPSVGGPRCNRCRCPSGFGGTHCETVQESQGSCGGMLTATSAWQTILVSSPSRHCNWLLKTGANGHIILEVISTNVRCRAVCRGYLEVKKGPRFDQTGYRFCCPDSWTNPIISSGNEMAIMLRAEPTTMGNWDIQFRFRTDLQSASSSVLRLSDGTWGAWNGWSQCSVTCGGCGSKERHRECSSSACGKGETSEKRACGEAPCGGPSTVINALCQRNEPVPCKRQKREWRSNGGSSRIIDLGSDSDMPIRRNANRRLRRQESCGTRTVSFMCAQGNPHFLRLLTAEEQKKGILASGWNRAPNHDGTKKQCCNGFEKQGNACVPRKPD